MNSKVPSQYLQELGATLRHPPPCAALFCLELSVEVEFVSVPFMSVLFLRAGFSQAFATVHIRHNNINCFEIITYLQGILLFNYLHIKCLRLVRLLRTRGDASLLGTTYCYNRILGVLEFSRRLSKLLGISKDIKNSPDCRISIPNQK